MVFRTVLSYPFVCQLEVRLAHDLNSKLIKRVLFELISAGSWPIQNHTRE